MPEAVIVSTARSPIGRAFKGSLKDLRPDDLAATIVRAALDKVPELDPRDIDDLMLGCGLPGGEQGYNMGRVVAVQLGMDHLPGTHGHPLLLLLAADHPHGAARHQGRRGRRLHLGRRRDGVPLRQGQQRPPAGHAEPALRRGRGPSAAKAAESGADRGPTRARTASSPTPTSPWARPPRTWPGSRASPARRWTSSASAARTSPRRPSTNGFWEREITPVTTPDGTVVSKDDGPRARRHPGGRGRPEAGLPPRRPGHRRQLLPAQRRRRRAGHHERHQGPRAGPDPAGPHRLDRRHRPLPRDHGLGPVEASQAGAAARRA